jgi:hypothetical protein
VLSEERRFMVGRSGSSAGVLVVPVVDPVLVGGVVLVVSVVLSGDRRFMVGRSGSSDADEVLPVPFAAPASVGVLPDVLAGEAGLLAGGAVPPAAAGSLLAESPEDPGRRFMVGRSGSSVEAGVEAGVVGVEAVEGVVELAPEPVAAGFAWSVPAEAVVLPVGFEPKCGLLESLTELFRTGSVFERFSATGFFVAASGLTLP